MAAMGPRGCASGTCDDRRVSWSGAHHSVPRVTPPGTHGRVLGRSNPGTHVSRPRSSPPPGSLFLVATPIGNLEDTRRTRRLLAHYGIAAPRLVSLFEGNERGRIPELLAELADGRNVAVVTDAGSPAVSDPGFPLVRAAVE